MTQVKRKKVKENNNKNQERKVKHKKAHMQPTEKGTKRRKLRKRET